MKGNRVVLLVAILAGVLTYGGLVGGEALLTGGDEPMADEAVVQGTTIHLDRAGRPTAVGEVANRYGEPISDVTVTVRFLNDGELVAERTGGLFRETVPSGGAAPFSIRTNESDEVDEVTATVSYDRGGDPVSGLSVSDREVVRESQDQIDVAATVTNEADRPLRLAGAVATFYDENRATIGARAERPDRRIEPGESVTVRISFRTLGDVPSYAREFASFRVSVVAEETG